MRISDWSSDVCSSDLPVQRLAIAHKGGVAGVAIATQQPIELHQLAALALPANPATFERIPAAFAVQQHEWCAACAIGMPGIERMHALCDLQQQYLLAVDLTIGRASCRELVCQYVSISVVAAS